MNNFKEMVLLYEELLRKEVEVYCFSNPNMINAGSAAMWEFAPRRVKDTLELIYGRETVRIFLEEYQSKKEALK